MAVPYSVHRSFLLLAPSQFCKPSCPLFFIPCPSYATHMASPFFLIDFTVLTVLGDHYKCQKVTHGLCDGGIPLGTRGFSLIHDPRFGLDRKYRSYRDFVLFSQFLFFFVPFVVLFPYLFLCPCPFVCTTHNTNTCVPGGIFFSVSVLCAALS